MNTITKAAPVICRIILVKEQWRMLHLLSVLHPQGQPIMTSESGHQLRAGCMFGLHLGLLSM